MTHLVLILTRSLECSPELHHQIHEPLKSPKDLPKVPVHVSSGPTYLQGPLTWLISTLSGQGANGSSEVRHEHSSVTWKGPRTYSMIISKVQCPGKAQPIDPGVPPSKDIIFNSTYT